MCGRFTQRYTWSEVHSFLSVIGAARNLPAPVQHRAHHDDRRRGP